MANEDTHDNDSQLRALLAERADLERTNAELFRELRASPLTSLPRRAAAAAFTLRKYENVRDECEARLAEQQQQLLPLEWDTAQLRPRVEGDRAYLVQRNAEAQRLTVMLSQIGSMRGARFVPAIGRNSQD